MSRTYKRELKDRDRIYRTEPKWHRKLHKHRVRRQAVRKAITDVERGDEDVLFPLDKRPWRWYW